MEATRRRDTPAELALRTELARLGLRYRVDVPSFPGSRRRADIVFARARVAVFVDGCFWHGCPVHATWPKQNRQWWRAKIHGNRRRDRDTNRRLEERGWLPVRAWAHEDMRLVAATIARIVTSRRAESPGS
jgi:DNA mismatch endonuclease (patch repair protein)